MPLVVMRHCRAAALLHRQAGLSAVERLDLGFFVDRQHHRVRRRIDIKTDNVAQLGDKLAIARQLELAHAMRLEPMGVPDPLHRADADPDLLGHHFGRPMGDFARRIGLRQRNRLLVHCCRQPRDPRRPGLVAQQPVHPLRHETLLPAPHRDLALARPAHDRGRADAVRRHQHDARSPHMLLSAVPIRDDRLQTRTIGGIHLDCDPLAHARPPSPTTPSIHHQDSFVRFYPLARTPQLDSAMTTTSIFLRV